MTFAGDKKVGQSILGPAETRFKNYWVPKLPAYVETYHLTMTTVLWSIGMAYCGYRAGSEIAWSFGMSLMMVMQYITDLFDGAVGRYRNTGLVKWGFFMDHFLDFIFSCSIVAAYAMMAPQELTWYFYGLMACSGGLMVNSFLKFAATNEFEIFFYGIGPTEIRLVYIIMNTVIFFFGTGIFSFWVPFLFYANIITLTAMVWKTHKHLWAIDMASKK
ncbi:MAG: hypothetical protein JW745_05475 [Sedimentisphaerales bacterium]|nr:hypothetical protein [Sedimentisphaerales bacterium]MBN2842614.1 hypothetical protein [Sedimentisphaerales bacterium]